MRCLQVLLLFGICHNILASGMQDNSAFYDLESRLLRLENRQFSERQNLEHRMLHLEAQLGVGNYVPIEQEPQIYTLDGGTVTQNLPSDDLKLVDRLEKLEKNWEKDLEEKLAEFSSKYDNLAEWFSEIENYVQKKHAVETVLSYPKTDQNSVYKLEEIGERAYLIAYNKKLSWIDALAICRHMNTSLVSLQSEEEWRALKDHLDTDKSYWVDLQDEGEYMTALTDLKAPFLRWDAREPKNLLSENRYEDCVELGKDYDHYMNVIHCSEENYYICEK